MKMDSKDRLGKDALPSIQPDTNLEAAGQELALCISVPSPLFLRY